MVGNVYFTFTIRIQHRVQGQGGNQKYLEVENGRWFEVETFSAVTGVTLLQFPVVLLTRSPTTPAVGLAVRECQELLIVSLAQISDHNTTPHPHYLPPHFNIPFFVRPPNIKFLSNSLMEFYRNCLHLRIERKFFKEEKNISKNKPAFTIFIYQLTGLSLKNWGIRLFLKQLKLSVISVRMRVHRPRIEQGRQQAWRIITSQKN